MIRRILLSRRWLLASALVGAGALFTGWRSVVFPRAAHAPWPSAYDALAGLCAKLAHPETVGRACLAALPAREATRERLAGLILENVEPSRNGSYSVDWLGRKMSEKSRADFRAGRIVSVDGWILSLTETRLYALAALQAAEG
jgi:hypothetical protein